jgi:hypothetical protein
LVKLKPLSELFSEDVQGVSKFANSEFRAL